MRLKSIHIYPIKSVRGLDLDRSAVEPWGLAGDRRWMLIAPDGRRVNAKDHRTLLHVDAVPTADGALDLAAPGAPALHVPTPEPTELLTAIIGGAEVKAAAAGPAADAWFSAYLDDNVRLVWLDDPTRRPVNPTYAEPGDVVTFSDEHPLLLTSTTSLHQLRDWMAETAVERGEELPPPLPMHRFRPNVIVEGIDTAFAEDSWKRVRLGSVEFRVAKLCDRCALPTVDVDTLQHSKEPTRTLAKHRRWDGHVWFGVRLTPVTTGEIALGDPVTVVT